MELILKRLHKTANSTTGELAVNGKFECYTLEDIEREVKIKSKTAIPIGRYEVVITFSNRFKKPLPLLLKVPNFEGIRIHTGNTAKDTEGCILVGKTRSVDMIGNSRLAFESLFLKLVNAAKKEKIFITIT
jgi:Family of unknown function (DUF5675)